MNETEIFQYVWERLRGFKQRNHGKRPTTIRMHPARAERWFRNLKIGPHFNYNGINPNLMGMTVVITLEVNEDEIELI